MRLSGISLAAASSTLALLLILLRRQRGGDEGRRDRAREQREPSVTSHADLLIKILLVAHIII
jgi:hypothetical protein